MTGFAALFHALEAVGIGLDVESARDAVWLAPYLLKNAGASEEPLPLVTPTGRVLSTTAQPPDAAVTARTPGESRESDRPGAAATLATSALPAVSLSRVRLPLAAGLAGQRGIPGALRPLRRKVRSLLSGSIDEEATVRRLTQDDIWLPVYGFMADRWLELALVVDESVSMAVWQDLERELRRVFRRAAAFRDIRVWRLVTEGKVIGARPVVRSASDAKRPLIDRCPFGGGRRGLVLLMTDCVSDGWYNGRVLSLLHRWSFEAPVALLQVLPDRMWARTALGESIAVTLRAAMTAMTNPHLHWVADLPVPEAGWRSQGAGVGPDLALFPIVTAEPRSLRQLARMVAGISSESMPGALFDTTVSDEPVAAAPAPNPADHVRRFWSVSSSAASDLASLLAAAPVQSTGMMRLLRNELMPNAEAGAEAEVLLSGLLTAPKDAGSDRDLPLQFRPGVQQILLQNAPVDRVLEVLRKVAARVSIPGIVPQTFETWIDNPSSGEEQLKPEDTIAAQMAAVLEQIGGAYGRIVHREGRRRPAATSSAADQAGAADTKQSAAGPDLRTIRIFVASAGDVREERRAVLDVASELNATAAQSLNIKLETILWEELPLSQNAAPSSIAGQLERAEIYVGIVSRRFGSAMEEEFRLALDRFQRTRMPRILLYFDNRPADIAGKRGSAESIEQPERVLEFRKQVEQFGFVKNYRSGSEFREHVARDLLAVSRELAAEPARAREPHMRWSVSRAEPFVDRADELEQLRVWWRSAEAGPLAILGPEGVGKSALVAQWLPEVIAEGRRGGIFVESINRQIEETLMSAIAYFSGTEPKERHEIRRLIDLLVEAVARSGPHLLVFDDFDQMGGEDYGVWMETIDRISQLPHALVLVIVRSVAPRVPNQIVLRELSVEASMELLRAVGVTESPDRLNTLLSWLAGNPAFLVMAGSALRARQVTVKSLIDQPRPAGSREMRELLRQTAEKLALSRPETDAAELEALSERLEKGEHDVRIEDPVTRAREQISLARSAMDWQRAGELASALGRLLQRANRPAESAQSFQEALEAYTSAEMYDRIGSVTHDRDSVEHLLAGHGPFRPGLLHTEHDDQWVATLRNTFEPQFKDRVKFDIRNIRTLSVETRTSGDFDSWLRRRRLLFVLVSNELFRAQSYSQLSPERRFKGTPATVVPMIVRPCDWQKEKWIVERQVIPSGGRSLSDTGLQGQVVSEVAEILRRGLDQHVSEDPRESTPR